MSTAFPTLRIRADALEPRGAFAEAQATYLRPNARAVAELSELLASKQIGVVAHFYMDVELQGVLSACSWPHIHVADSLAMADRAVRMAEAGMKAIVVLGVDFMSENVRAVLDAAGFGHVAVFRLAADAIGCSLAESANTAAYEGWLREAAATPRSLHVVYINTSLLTKARAHHLVPTLTCTSSNVVRTLLQAFAQIPDLHVWYGPDTYMGANLERMLTDFQDLPAAAIRALHPAHDRATLASALDRFHAFPSGICVVHHLFGADVVERVRADHPDALLTAHLEVPGEMFALAVKAQADGRGVVGSTSNILDFIRARVADQVGRAGPALLPVVLGTEAGMITQIVRHVQGALREASRDDIGVEVIFPVASEAIVPTSDADLVVVPGVAGGEGCSTSGGCATCPFMKKNDLDALFEVVEAIGTDAHASLAAYAPRKYEERIGGRTAADLGSEPILAMRHFQKTGELPSWLVERISR